VFIARRKNKEYARSRVVELADVGKRGDKNESPDEQRKAPMKTHYKDERKIITPMTGRLLNTLLPLESTCFQE